MFLSARYCSIALERGTARGRAGQRFLRFEGLCCAARLLQGDVGIFADGVSGKPSSAARKSLAAGIEEPVPHRLDTFDELAPIERDVGAASAVSAHNDERPVSRAVRNLDRGDENEGRSIFFYRRKHAFVRRHDDTA